ncbi:MAG: hypothetical protein P1U82_15720 [Verrucomicrobiales bacterium]|nr:hypothetical protein [Verrucomicrobiales bacterium]
MTSAYVILTPCAQGVAPLHPAFHQQLSMIDVRIVCRLRTAAETFVLSLHSAKFCGTPRDETLGTTIRRFTLVRPRGGLIPYEDA